MRAAICRYDAIGIWMWGLVIPQILLSLTWPQNVRARGPDLGQARHLTQQAIDAGLAGDLPRRHELLRKAIQIAPNFASARWEAGQILVDDQWVSLDEAQAASAGDPQLTQYRQLRRQMPDAPGCHLQLARWCRRNQLADEARYHWLRVLSCDAENREALAGLDCTWCAGRLVTNDVAHHLRQKRREQRPADRQWRIHIAKWERAQGQSTAEAEGALDELRKTVDISAIPEFERLASDRQPEKSIAAARRQRLSLAFIAALDEISSHAATESLLRHAVLAADASLREAASDALIDRPAQESVPLLLSGLASPIESVFNLRVSPLGYVTYSHEFFAEGPAADHHFERAKSVSFDVTQYGSLKLLDRAQTMGPIAEAKLRSRALTRQKLQALQREAAQMERQVAEENLRRQEINERIIAALQKIVGKDLGDDPLAWWDYWRDYNEYEEPPYRPTEYERDYRYERHTISILPPTPLLQQPRTTRPPRTTRTRSCFVAGTPVWTKTGLASIQSLAAGDLVLSQDLSTGELHYRPVLATTKRAPSPTLKILAGGEEIRTTLGHPFWLPAVDWRMAKELAHGDVLLAVGDPLRIEKISAAGDEVAFNLVVEGPGNYYVGRSGVLVHDNTPRRPEPWQPQDPRGKSRANLLGSERSGSSLAPDAGRKVKYRHDTIST